MRTSQSHPAAPAAPSDRWLVWFAAPLAAFLAVRASTTLLAGASFDAPGDGWRSLWQLAIVAVLVAGLGRRDWLPTAVRIVAVVYLAAASVELVTPDDLFGVIPVDMRDRFVHPLVGVLGAIALMASSRGAISGRVEPDGGDR
jgi:hypothetical protein